MLRVDLYILPEIHRYMRAEFHSLSIALFIILFMRSSFSFLALSLLMSPSLSSGSALDGYMADAMHTNGMKGRYMMNAMTAMMMPSVESMMLHRSEHDIYEFFLLYKYVS